MFSTRKCCDWVSKLHLSHNDVDLSPNYFSEKWKN